MDDIGFVRRPEIQINQRFRFGRIGYDVRSRDIGGKRDGVARFQTDIAVLRFDDGIALDNEKTSSFSS